MSEMTHIGIIEEKLDNICEKNGLTCFLKKDRYPVMMIIRPVQSMDNQMSMLEADEADKGQYISPNAKMIFSMKEDGMVDFHAEGTFTIAIKLQNKLQNLFKRFHMLYCQYVHRECVEKGMRLPDIIIPEDDEDLAEKFEYDPDNELDEDVPEDELDEDPIEPDEPEDISEDTEY